MDRLRLVNDPEVEGLTTLFAIVRTTGEPGQVHRALKTLDAEWLSSQDLWVQRLFNVDVEFV